MVSLYPRSGSLGTLGAEHVVHATVRRKRRGETPLAFQRDLRVFRGDSLGFGNFGAICRELPGVLFGLKANGRRHPCAARGRGNRTPKILKILKIAKTHLISSTARILRGRGALGGLSSSFCDPKTFLDEKLELAHRKASQTIQKHLGNAHTDTPIDILSRTVFL